MANRGGSRPGAGRKASEPGNKRRRLSTTISNASWQVLKELAGQHGGSVSQALDALIVAAAAERGLPLPEPHPLKVLVVDDDPHSLELLFIRLEAMGCQVLRATTVGTGLALAQDEQPALAIVDLELDGDKQAGLKLIEQLRADERTARIPLVIHSIFVFHRSDLPVALPDVHALLPKPFTRDQLREVLERATGRPEETEVVII